jgi:acetyl-CoA synthetase
MDRSMTIGDEFLRAREVLLKNRDDYDAAYREFRWPAEPSFNWATHWFDAYARGNSRLALKIVSATATVGITYAEMSERSTRVARWLADDGVAKGDRILVMLPNVAPLWELVLGAMKLGAVLIPSTTQLTQADIDDRVSRGKVTTLIVDESGIERAAAVKSVSRKILVGGGSAPGFTRYEDLYSADASFSATDPVGTHDPLFLYFTSGTTAKPKLVLHTQRSYPIGHLSTMYWIGIREGSVHQNISSPGWAKHAWSCIFAPWNAGATSLVHDYARFSARATLQVLAEEKVASLCAPPTVWRMLILEALGQKPPSLEETVSAGEPLNPEVIEQVRTAWGLTIRDGFGQTETTAVIGNSPGQKVILGSMGRPLPGYQVAPIDHQSKPTDEGELSLVLEPRPAGLMVGYSDDPEKTALVMADGYYRTGDEARRDEEGYYHFVGRGDDVFKSSDYRISPFELESVLVEHPAVAEAAIVPSPDPLRLSVPKAFIALAPGFEASPQTATDILAFAREKLAPYKRIRRLEFAELPKTISGKIRRVELRKREEAKRAELGETRGESEFWL